MAAENILAKQTLQQSHTLTMYIYTTNVAVSTSYVLWFPKYSPDKVLKVKVIMARSHIKSRSHHDVTHLQPPTNVATKHVYKLSAAYRYSQDKILKVKMLFSATHLPTGPAGCHG